MTETTQRLPRFPRQSADNGSHQDPTASGRTAATDGAVTVPMVEAVPASPSATPTARKAAPTEAGGEAPGGRRRTVRRRSRTDEGGLGLGRDVVVKIRLTAEQHAAWNAAAGGGGKLSAWLRRAADERVGGTGRGRSVTAEEIDRLEASLVALRREFNRAQIGNNVNQIAKALNTRVRMGRRVSGEPYALALAQMADAHHEMKDAVALALARVRKLRP